MNSLFESIPFAENPLYENIIADILSKQYSIIDNFFTSEEVLALRQSLLYKYEEDTFKKSAIGNRTNEVIKKAIRGDIILWIDEDRANNAETMFFNKINDLKDYLNRTCFLGINQKEFHYAIYPEGTFYKRHLDTFQNDDRRKLSFVCYLNEENWKPENGGELVLYLEDVEKTIYPFPGKVVIFESQVLEHEVKPVNTPRLSITGWLKTR
ncbi:2OG-Fe(II) oxygenase [Winogradskyella sp. HB-48]|uniref:2OG-Fe(II) oxygenase n=1 Tax=Winogradskyella sp. HB-48 TaxID=3416808 RepID=UPI003CE819A3